MDLNKSDLAARSWFYHVRNLLRSVSTEDVHYQRNAILTFFLTNLPVSIDVIKGHPARKTGQIKLQEFHYKDDEGFFSLELYRKVYPHLKVATYFVCLRSID
ncbi:hypothetical protein A3K34_02190 [candidate division WWE3 bacterium RIFOXYC1_FULL_40_10]|uniref:Uncharacterized protein n=1 Tax=candidate division WWE3 bacterium RIFOXYA2_FULL_46_9 TaxID=1802636 RepID=A0A1F4W1J0_UNCKA|nr:MAG: hypothetical protein A3K58_02190 [candidate division WWE3 bacterium RIFOXYB1_FULL_40_22]OGC61663.1 MAG: hypothetical protein A3K37_02190 [candidate division WWE3 bacterium RIFOXYA1_FULL_40_11]OGC63289.1 MAG: hypothetical protein A2264_02810 [candidate division WWE3 bacterium RIFOXYA2_FULL_46_9]OGC64420.1 MAG: hypothetical protein A2326_02645 [candidate division WWE3 bacterium RIFOXYB2_FULL_41_6]OGC66046.1 MAG: hypothetical protein A3K34_02190 [candidate division WWE3 bacterium RIFOXYC1_